MRRSWDKIQTEARQAAVFLQEPTPEVLSTELAGLGDGSTSGKTREKVVEAWKTQEQRS